MFQLSKQAANLHLILFQVSKGSAKGRIHFYVLCVVRVFGNNIKNANTIYVKLN